MEYQRKHALLEVENPLQECLSPAVRIAYLVHDLDLKTLALGRRQIDRQ